MTLKDSMPLRYMMKVSYVLKVRFGVKLFGRVNLGEHANRVVNRSNRRSTKAGCFHGRWRAYLSRTNKAISLHSC